MSDYEEYNNSLDEAVKPCDCQSSKGCMKTGYQYADINIPIDLKPNTTIGEIESECCGEPAVHCKENTIGNTCEITITQKVRIKIPVTFNVIACVGDEQINCFCEDCCHYPDSK
ncbi:MAG: hypothetical protein J6I65_00530 [Lachnospiraceae bacterium]|nr:hypothetical protein [Lachnospiraceae bacterium]